MGAKKKTANGAKTTAMVPNHVSIKPKAKYPKEVEDAFLEATYGGTVYTNESVIEATRKHMAHSGFEIPYGELSPEERETYLLRRIAWLEAVRIDPGPQASTVYSRAHAGAVQYALQGGPMRYCVKETNDGRMAIETYEETESSIVKQRTTILGENNEVEVTDGIVGHRDYMTAMPGLLADAPRANDADAAFAAPTITKNLYERIFGTVGMPQWCVQKSLSENAEERGRLLTFTLRGEESPRVAWVRS